MTAAGGDPTYDLPTDLGPARVLAALPAGPARATLVLGHGAGGGSEARDLLALARGLPGHGVAVLRVDQPWRVAGRRVAPPPAVLDRAWLQIVPALELRGEAPLFVGGRSAGARVACRTAVQLGAAGVVALAFPLRPPGRGGSRPSRAGELVAGVPVLVVQGERDSFGGPGELPATVEVLAVPGADHAMRVPARSLPGQAAVLAAVAHEVAAWILDRTGNTPAGPGG